MATKAKAKKILDILNRAKKAVPSGSRLTTSGWSKPSRTVDALHVHEAIDNIASCVVPRFVPVTKSVAPADLDRKGSLIGGCGFISNSYPTPMSVIRKTSFPMAPLAQLDLDQIGAETGEDVGRGLLQIWLPRDCWGQGEPTYCRVIPRGAVSRTKKLLPCQLPRVPLFLEHGYDPAELDVLDEVDPEAAEELRYYIKYWGAVSGFDWSLNEELNGQFPKQIMGWKQKGFALPSCLEDKISDSELEGWSGAAEYLDIVSGIADGEFRGRLRPALFEESYDASFFWPDEYRDEPAVINGWRPLFCFHGPAEICPVEDTHFVMFRRKGRQFEYVSGCSRWSW